MAGNSEDLFSRRGLGKDVGDGPGNPKGLVNMRKAKFVPDIVGNGGIKEADLPDLKTAMILVDDAG